MTVTLEEQAIAAALAQAERDVACGINPSAEPLRVALHKAVDVIASVSANRDTARAEAATLRAEVADAKVRADAIETERMWAVSAFHRTRQERDAARAEVATLRAQVAELTAGIDAVIDRKRIADDKPEILHTLQRHYEMVCETAGKANDTIEDIGKALKIDALESDDIVADVRAHVAELTRHGASIHKAAGAARRAERADVVAELRRLYAAQRSEETPVAATLDILIGLFESGTHEGAATPK